MFPLIHLQTSGRPLNSHTNNPLIRGHTFLTYLTNNPLLEQVMFFPLLPLVATPQGGSNYQTGGLTLGAPMHPVVIKTPVTSPCQEISILHNKGVVLCLTKINFRWEDTLNLAARWVQIPNRGCILM